MATKKTLKRCVGCEKDMAITSNFYSTNSTMFADGKVPLCKKCIRDQIDETDTATVKRVLRQIDKPFIYTLWKKSEESEKETFGTYIKNINSLPQYRDLTYDDSIDYSGKKGEPINGSDDVENIQKIETEEGSIKISKEIKAKFGSGYTNREYLEMEKFYQDMMTSYDISTPQHKTILIEVSQLNVEKKRLISDGNYGDYKKVADAYKSLIADAGFRPADRVSGSESSGIRTFSQIWEEVEKDGFIEPPDLSFSQDIIDKTILFMENNFRSLLNADKLTEVSEDRPKVDD